MRGQVERDQVERDQVGRDQVERMMLDPSPRTFVSTLRPKGMRVAVRAPIECDTGYVVLWCNGMYVYEEVDDFGLECLSEHPPIHRDTDVVIPPIPHYRLAVVLRHSENQPVNEACLRWWGWEVRGPVVLVGPKSEVPVMAKGANWYK